MKFMVVLIGLFALAVAEEDVQDQTQQTENPGNAKPNLGTLATTPTQNLFAGQTFPTTSLNFGGKDGVGSIPLTGLGGNFPTLQGVPGQEYFANTQGAVGGLPAFAQIPRTAYQGATGLGGNLQPGFHVPAVSSVPVVSGLGNNHFTGLTGAVYPSFQNGGQGVPVGGFNGNAGNAGFSGTPYRVLPQEALSGFTPQGLQPQNVPLTSNPGLTSFPAGLTSWVPNGVFPGNQGILKTPLTGTGHSPLNVPTLTTGNVQADPTGTVFRRA